MIKKIILFFLDSVPIETSKKNKNKYLLRENNGNFEK